jgi:hypothetical protein
MPADAAPSSRHTLDLTTEERDSLLSLLQQALRETWVEVHRTHTPNFRDQVLHHEELLKGLIDKLQRPSS